jgi:uncharacterized protein (DUF2141 family)
MFQKAFASAILAALVSLGAAPAVLASTVADGQPAPETFTLTVTVEGVQSSLGQIRASLLKADYAAGTAPSISGAVVDAVAGTTTLVFTGLSEGDYAVQLFHDEDGDGEMKTNLFGIPNEGYGFSNRAAASFGPPRFSDMKVEVRANADTAVQMAY